MKKNKITVVGGAGHIGLPLSIVFANKGFDVFVLDKNLSAIDYAKRGRMPFKEKTCSAITFKLGSSLSDLSESFP